MIKMLHQIKHMLPDGWGRTRRALRMDATRWEKLEVGKTVCFGPMRQEELNHARLPISAKKDYEFPQGRFTAYRIQAEGKPELWMIVAQAQGVDPYLAISRKLSKRDLEDLLAAEDVQVITHSSRIKHLLLREQTPGLRDWVTLRYERRIEGIRGKQHEDGKERVFEYELYVSDRNSHAIEIERYLDGHMDAFATLYRPVSDILEVLDAPRVPLPSVRTTEATPLPVKPATPTTQKSRPAANTQASLKDVEQTRKIHQQPAVVKAASASKPSPSGRIECDITTAWRLIDEALRGGLRLSDVVRKVLGLPLKTNDLISFDFSLTPEDYEELGKRYGMHPDNQAAIHARIIQELEAFAGKGSR